VLVCLCSPPRPAAQLAVRPKMLNLRPELNPRPRGANVRARYRVTCGKGILVNIIITTRWWYTTTTTTIKRAQMTRGAGG
jgi:hypothetical protein